MDSRNSETLIPLIQKHVRPGTRIYSDSWAAYMHLNTLGYQHFTVEHKTTFKQRYCNVDMGEVVDCHTNRIEGAWKICKDHFRRIKGTNTKLFEQHIAEIVWRNHFHRDNVYEAFFNLLRDIYTLHVPASYTYTVPLFTTLHHPTQYKPIKRKGKKCTKASTNKKTEKSTKSANLYSRAAYRYEFSSPDSDFQ